MEEEDDELCKIKGGGKVGPIRGHEGPEGEVEVFFR
jgi:hypothetical protein